MPRKKRDKTERDRLIEELLDSLDDPAEMLGADGLLKQLKKRSMERILQAELTEHISATRSTTPTVEGLATLETGRRRRRC